MHDECATTEAFPPASSYVVASESVSDLIWILGWDCRRAWVAFDSIRVTAAD